MICIPLYGVVKIAYENIEKKCSIGCGAILKLKDVALHEIECGKPKCDNHGKCRKNMTCVINGFKVCSEKCSIYLTVNKQSKIEKEDLSQQLVALSIRMSFITKKIHSFCYWDTINRSSEIDISSDLKTGKNISEKKCFQNVISKLGFCSGVTIIEMELNIKQEKPAKIGVVSSLNFDRTKAFSDSRFGYAYYTLGQLRNGDHGKGRISIKKAQFTVENRTATRSR